MNKTVNGLLRTVSLIALAVLSTSALHASISVTLSPSVASPKPVGTVVIWTATVQDSVGGTHEYQFSVGPEGGPAAIVRNVERQPENLRCSGSTSAGAGYRLAGGLGLGCV